jgi:hypothetical protein
MKNKIYKLLGVALVLVLLASLTVGLTAIPAAADPGKLKFDKVSLPKMGEDGRYVLTPESELGPIATSPAGEALFAAVYDYDADTTNGPAWQGDPIVMKSTDGGYTWKALEGFWDASTGADIVDIVVSPEYADDSTVFVATEDYIYQSVNGGDDFTDMDAEWVVGTEEITDLDVTIDSSGRLALIVGTKTTSTATYAGDVYAYAPATTGMAWERQCVDGTLVAAASKTYDVLAAAFSPNFKDDEGIVAVVTNAAADNPGFGTLGKTYVRFSFGYTGADEPGPGWVADYGDGRIRDAWDHGFFSTRARIAFPDDFDAEGVGNNVLYAGIYAGITGTDAVEDDLIGAMGERGDVYKVTMASPPFSRAVDVDVRGVVTTLNPTETNIYSIDAAGNAEECSLLVGTDYWHVSTTPAYFLVYRSTDAGTTWIPSGTKSPTGASGVGVANANTQVLMSYDFLSSGVAYAATADGGATLPNPATSAFSRSADSGATWNQISLIDYGNPYAWGVPVGYAIPGGVTAVDAAGYNAAGTLHMVTQVDLEGNPANGTTFGAVWQTMNKGKNWERIWSYANPGVSLNILEVYRTGEETIYCTDYAAEKMYRSSNMGATWPKKITTKVGLTAVTIVSETTIYTGQADGGIWYSTKSGASWKEPDENAAAGRGGIMIIMVNGDNVLVGNSNGMVFFSSNALDTVKKLGLNNPGDPLNVALPSFDLGFAANNYAYCTLVEIDAFPPTIPPVGLPGVFRIEVDAADPDSTSWGQIDDLNPDGSYVWDSVSAGSPAISLPPSGVLYVIDKAAVDTGPDPDDLEGGLWRSTSATADVYGAHPPYFEKENRGLATGDSVGFAALDVFPTTFFCNNGAADNYYEQLVTYTDTLDVGVPLVEPANNATGVGLLPAGHVYPEVIGYWKTMAGATSYQYQVAIDADFNTIVAEGAGFTDALATPSMTLEPNKTYYWRVRVANRDADGILVGAPLISPWAEVWKFKTALGAVKARPDLEAPWAGEPDVSLTPTFEWSGIEWAIKYEYQLAIDPATTAGGYFAAPLKDLTGTNALVSTAWKCDIQLEYTTRYYWQVKAIGVDTETPWSDVGTFTTMSEAPPPPAPIAPVVVPPAQQITPAWIYAIIAIGAVLVIAVIVLIVTTRRVP